MKKKIMVMLMAACVVLSGLAGCGKTNGDDVSGVSPASQEKAAETEAQQEVRTEDREEVSILLESSPYVIDYETNLLTQMIEEKFNVDLQFEYLPATEAADKLSLMINSGEELPDVICYNLSMDEATRYGTMGAFLPLENYIENISVNMKRYDEMYSEYRILQSITSYDGHIYNIPSYSDNHISNEVRYKYWINQDWLDALDLEMPETTEEFYHVLKAFKEEDPNGNGKADEIPLIGSTGWSADVNMFLINAFGFSTDGNMLMARDGKVEASYTQDYYKDALEYIQRLTSEGLLDTSSYTMDLTQMQSLINNEGTSVVGCFAYSSNDLITEDDRKLSYVGLAPLTGPNGYHGASIVLAQPKPYWFVTSDAENPELAFLIGDYLFDEEMYYAERFGVQGENWDYTDDTMVGAYEAFGYPSKTYILNNIWTENQNVHWRCAHPCLALTVQYSDIYYTEEECREDITKAMRNLLSDAIGIYQTDRADMNYYVGNLSFTDDERDAITGIESDVKTFAKEQTVLFASGGRDLATWDQYLEELENAGLSVYLKACQSAYDRANEE